MDRLDTLLFINCGDIFIKIVSFMEFIAVMRINASSIFNAPAWAPKIKKMPQASKPYL